MRIMFLMIFAALLNQPVHEVHMSEEISFNQNNSPLFSFGLIADAQYCDRVSAGTRYYRSSLSKLKEAVGTFKENSVSFIINLGDLIDRDIESYDPTLAILNSSGIKTYHCTGNHDYAVKPELKDQIPVLKPDEKGYYSFKVGKFRMIILNGNEISTYASNNKEVTDRAAACIKKLEEEGAENAIDWNGGIGRDQLLWLENQLKDAEIKSEQAIIFCHFPIAPDNIHNLLNYKDLLLVVEKNKSAVAWFNGHNHSGNYAGKSGKHFITMKGMVETESTNSFALVDVYNDRLVINGYGNEIDRTLLFK